LVLVGVGEKGGGYPEKAMWVLEKSMVDSRWSPEKPVSVKGK
jgi:hypothetical protein